jgi:hypothetical protein
MAVENLAWSWSWSVGMSVSMQVNFAPQLAVAQASLTAEVGAASCAGGITGYGTPGAFAVFPFNDDYGWPPVVSSPQMNKVTAILDANIGDQGASQGVMTLMVSLWT